MEVIEKQNYNQSVKINDRNIKCYSKKKLNELYPSGNYSIFGETFENNKKKVKDTIILGKKKLNVSEYGKNSKLLYKRKGYLLVGDNEFIVLLQNRLPFIIIFILILSIGIGVGVWGYNTFINTPVVAPEYPLPPEDDKSKDIKNDNSKVDTGEYKNHVSIKITREVSVNLKNKKVSFKYQNFNASNKDAVVTLCILKDDNEYAIARTGLIKSGKEISEMSMLNDAIKITQGVYKGRIKIDFYDETTGEKAATSTDFDDVEVTVK